MEEWASLNNLPAEVETIGFGSGRLSTEIETTVYRVAQESLQNILKHAKGVKNVSVILRRESRQVLAIIEDDGSGFDPEAVRYARPEPESGVRWVCWECASGRRLSAGG